MGDHRFPGNLDPRAQEFVPGNPNFHGQTLIPFPTQSQVYFQFTPPPEIIPPPPPPPPAATYFQNYGQVVNIPPFYNNYPYGNPSLQFAPPPPPDFPPRASAPSRALLLTSVPCDVSESTVRRDLEIFGDVRGVQMERVFEGIVTVHFYDLRDSEAALREINEQHVRRQVSPFLLPPHVPSRGLISGQPVWARFVVPTTGAVPGGCNQGTVVVFNLDPAVSSSTLTQLFEQYGAVKELRETPFKKHQRFVEFFDVRDASNALQEMNGKEINNKQILIEFSRPGGYKNKCLFRRVIQPPHPPQPQPPRQGFSGWLRKKHYSKNNGNPNLGVESFMSTLSINSNGDNHRPEVNAGERSQRKSRGANCRNGSGKLWKNKHVKMDNARFLISEEESMENSSCKDPRTTLMIKNIPNKYSQKLLLNMLDNHCISCNEQIGTQGDESQPLSSYDFVYLPIDFGNKCNVGYGFVNMTSPQAAWRFYKAFHLQHWEVFNSRKICQVTYARLQGLEALKEHFKSTKFPCETEHYLPVVFTPPRDGVHLTDPVPIITTKGSTTGDDHDHDHDHSDGPDPSSSCGSSSHHTDPEEIPPRESSSSSNDSDNNDNNNDVVC